MRLIDLKVQFWCRIKGVSKHLNIKKKMPSLLRLTIRNLGYLQSSPRPVLLFITRGIFSRDCEETVGAPGMDLPRVEQVDGEVLLTGLP